MSSLYDWNQAVIKEFRENGGKVGGNFAGSTLLLLHTIGAKSGKEHVTPVMYSTDGDHLFIIASKAGAPEHPSWYHNIAANPVVTLEVGSETYKAKAVIAPEPERTRLFAKMVSIAPGFGQYQAKTTRIIPVVTLERIK